MATKPSRVVTLNLAFPCIKSHDPLIVWSSNFIPYIRFVGLECEHLSGHQFLVPKVWGFLLRNNIRFVWIVWDFVLKRSHLGIMRNRTCQHIDCFQVNIEVMKQIFEVNIRSRFILNFWNQYRIYFGWC